MRIYFLIQPTVVVAFTQAGGLGSLRQLQPKEVKRVNGELG